MLPDDSFSVGCYVLCSYILIHVSTVSRSTLHCMLWVDAMPGEYHTSRASQIPHWNFAPGLSPSIAKSVLKYSVMAAAKNTTMRRKLRGCHFVLDSSNLKIEVSLHAISFVPYRTIQASWSLLFSVVDETLDPGTRMRPWMIIKLCLEWTFNTCLKTTKLVSLLGNNVRSMYCKLVFT